MFGLQDSADAFAQDLKLIGDLLQSHDEVSPFKLSNVDIYRLGKNYVNRKNRLVKISSSNKEHVQWMFHQKNFIAAKYKSIIIY